MLTQTRTRTSTRAHAQNAHTRTRARYLQEEDVSSEEDGDAPSKQRGEAVQMTPDLMQQVCGCASVCVVFISCGRCVCAAVCISCGWCACAAVSLSSGKCAAVCLCMRCVYVPWFMCICAYARMCTCARARMRFTHTQIPPRSEPGVRTPKGLHSSARAHNMGQGVPYSGHTRHPILWSHKAFHTLALVRELRPSKYFGVQLPGCLSALLSLEYDCKVSWALCFKGPLLSSYGPLLLSCASFERCINS